VIAQKDSKEKGDKRAAIANSNPMNIRVSVLESNWRTVAGLTKEISSSLSTAGQRHQLNARVNRPNLAVIARGSYIARN
jgi:hypothetical protein